MTSTRNNRVLYISTLYFKGDIAHWCATNKTVASGLPNLPWMATEPDNGIIPEFSMAHFFFDNRMGIGDVNGIMPWNYICQWP